jgi:hypothetical protein
MTEKMTKKDKKEKKWWHRYEMDGDLKINQSGQHIKKLGCQLSPCSQVGMPGPKRTT